MFSFGVTIYDMLLGRMKEGNGNIPKSLPDMQANDPCKPLREIKGDDAESGDLKCALSRVCDVTFF